MDDMIRVRKAGPEDADAVTKVLITAMPQDREWYDYRFPYREEHLDDHSKFSGILVKTWISPEFDDLVVLVAECWDASAGRWEVASFAVWDLTYLNIRKFGVGYKPASAANILAQAGAGTRRDANPSHAREHFRAYYEGRTAFLDSRFGTEQMHLQALGTHPSYLRRGLARRLCQWGMDQAVRDGAVVTLVASPMGRNVYPRLGFEELGIITVQVEGEEEKTELTAMAWDPKKHS